MKLSIISSVLLALELATAGAIQKRYTDTTILKKSYFDDGSMGPFVECTTTNPSYVKETSGEPYVTAFDKLTAFFNEDYYNGQRDTKSAEFCASDGGTANNIHKEGWQGFAMYVPSGSYPTNSFAIFAQQFCFGGCGTDGSWCATLSLTDMSVVVDHRSYCGTPTEVTVVDALTPNTWHYFIVHIRFSDISDGIYQVWYDGTQVYDATGINIGFDSSWTTNGSLVTGAYFKNGMYNADTSVYQNTTKTLYFDNVAWYNVDEGQIDGYATVNPDEDP